MTNVNKKIDLSMLKFNTGNFYQRRDRDEDQDGNGGFGGGFVNNNYIM
jgi:hypothetical protein